MVKINIIKQFIHNLFKSKSKKRVDADSKTIFNVRVGKSFKGHAMNLQTHCFNGSKIINLYNQYYMGSVNCNYYLDSDKTVVEITKSEMVPKYIREKIKDEEFVKKIDLSNGHIKVSITSFNILTTSLRTYDGIHFNNHYENINKLKIINVFTKLAKKTFKDE
tara:strand:- start:269 stop:757 length:489 start_codon:yes stop_codon:yes gene_type:complete